MKGVEQSGDLFPPSQSREDPIELLVEMARRGEIDPWDVDIVFIIDRFFSEAERQRSLDLRVSGRMLFYAATMLRIKTEYFDTDALEENESEEDTWSDDTESGEVFFYRDRISGNPIEFLEKEIFRRLNRKNQRKQQVSVYMLINLLRDAEKEERRRQRESYPLNEFDISAEEISYIAHEESQQDAAAQVFSCCQALLKRGEQVTLSNIVCDLKSTPYQIFISLLFLAYEGFISLHQPEFFGEIYIKITPCSLP